MFNDDVNAAKLYIGSCTIVYCGDEVIGSLASVPFVNGVAAFQVQFYTFFSFNYILINFILFFI